MVLFVLCLISVWATFTIIRRPCFVLDAVTPLLVRPLSHFNVSP